MRVLLALLLVATTPVKPKPIVLHERGAQDALICAEYTVPSDPRQPNRSCVDAAQVRAWILQNGRPADECER